MVSEVLLVDYPSISASGKHFTSLCCQQVLWCVSSLVESGCGGPDGRQLHIWYVFGTRSWQITLFFFVIHISIFFFKYFSKGIQRARARCSVNCHLFRRVVGVLELIPTATGNSQNRSSGTERNPEHSPLLPREIPEILRILPKALRLIVNSQMSRRAEEQNWTGCLCNRNLQHSDKHHLPNQWRFCTSWLRLCCQWCVLLCLRD